MVCELADKVEVEKLAVPPLTGTALASVVPVQVLPS